MSVKVNALDHLVINVSDVARSAQWYQKILGMEIKVFDPGPGKTPRTSLMFGSQKINVRPRDGDKVEWFTADFETPGSDDLCFLTAATPDEVVAHLNACGVAIEEGPVRKLALAARCGRSIAGIPMAVSLRFRRMRMAYPSAPKSLQQNSSCPGLSRASTSLLSAPRKKDVDGRDKPGHDE
jgi:catechol 2,3-dioxygenase-like lactoylglutathione lyase family enzyme